MRLLPAVVLRGTLKLGATTGAPFRLRAVPGSAGGAHPLEIIFFEFQAALVPGSC